MLRIIIPPSELWDEVKEEFVYTKEQTLQLEHSLVSISKWESKWHKAFLGKQEKSFEEMIDYVRCMTMTQNVDPSVYYHLTNQNIAQIDQYIQAPMTATYISKDQFGKSGGETATAELIYYWMICYNIPIEFQKWHLNRLLTLIKICDIKNRPPRKRSQRDIMRQNRAINAARRKQHNTRG